MVRRTRVPSCLALLLVLLVGFANPPVAHALPSSALSASNSLFELRSLRANSAVISQVKNGNVTIHETLVGATHAGKLVGKLPADKVLNITVVLQFRNGTDPESYVRSIYDPLSPNYHNFLTPTSFAEMLAPSVSDYQSVVNWLTSEGLSVTKTEPDRIIIQASANARAIEAAFGVSLSIFRYGNATFYSNTAEARVPASIGGIVRTIVGLHNLTFARWWGRKSPASTSDPTYAPADIRTAYDDAYLVNNLGYTGTGQTIDILDAYNYPNLFSDLYYFDSSYSLPNPPSTVKVLVNGPSTCPSGSAACVETSMDTEWAHVMAPGANLHIVLVPDMSDNSLEAGIDYVVNHDPGIQIFSNSWGGPEICSFFGYNYLCDSSFINAVHPLLLQAASQGISTFFSSGDSGAYVNGVLTANYPASDPWVTGVGGTRLNSVSPRSETAWSVEQCASGSCSSGGGVSQVYGEPYYQSSDFSLTGRGVPDVSADADPYTGVQVYCTDSSCPSSHWFGEGGTSLSAPLWAGSVAVLNQAVASNFGFLNPLLYALYGTGEYSSDFHDITSGNNGYYSAGSGYDLVTGLGSPDLFKFAQNRGMTKVSVSPPTVSQGQSLSYSGSGFTPNGQVQVVIWTDGTGYVVGTPTASSSGTISGSFVVGTDIPLGQRRITFTDSSSGFVTTAYVTVTYTVTFQESGIPSGVTWGVTVGGTRYPATTSSLTLSGLTQPMSYSYDSTVPGASGVRYVCTSGCSGTVSVSTTVTANYQTQYYLTMQANPSNDGTYSPGSGWHFAGDNVPISATPNPGWWFSGWSGSGSGSCSGLPSACSSVTMNGPITEQANFQQLVYVTVTSSTFVTSFATTTSSTSTTSTFSTIAGSSTSTVSQPPLITSTVSTTTTVTGPAAGTSTNTFTSTLSTSSSTSSTTISTGETTVQTGVTTIGVVSSAATTSTGTALSSSTVDGTVKVSETDTFYVLWTSIVQELHRLADEILQMLGVQVTATPVDQQVNQVIVTVTTPTVTTTSLATVMSFTTTTSSTSTTSSVKSTTTVTSTLPATTQSPKVTKTTSTTTTTTGSVVGTSTTTYTAIFSTGTSTSTSQSTGRTTVQTRVTTVGTISSATTTSTAITVSTTTSGGTVTVSETDTFYVLWTSIIQELHKWANEVLKLLSVQQVSTPLAQQVRQVIVTVKPLTVTQTGPADGSSEPPKTSITLSVKVTSNGSPVQGATVKFSVNGVTVCTTTSNASGVASCTYKTGAAGHTYSWYATADKSAYAHAQSTTWTFHT